MSMCRKEARAGIDPRIAVLQGQTQREHHDSARRRLAKNGSQAMPSNGFKLPARTVLSRPLAPVARHCLSCSPHFLPSLSQASAQEVLRRTSHRSPHWLCKDANRLLAEGSPAIRVLPK